MYKGFVEILRQQPGKEFSMSEEKTSNDKMGLVIGGGTLLGGGIGAALGASKGDVTQGLWIGGMIGTGLGMLIALFTLKKKG
ncbi:MAG: hypothetical protein CMH54_01900 [Myxococcales bacterium]|nr:hypothetical protein [Myxococcales bacterium]